MITLIPIIIPPSPNPPPSLNAPNPATPKSSTTAVVVGSQTLLPGTPLTVGGTASILSNGQTTIIEGTIISIAPGGTQVVLGGVQTIDLPPPPPTPVVVTIGSSTITVTGAGELIVGSQTLAPEQAITVDGTIFSLARSASHIVIDGSTIPITLAPAPTVGSLAFTLNGESDGDSGSLD